MAHGLTHFKVVEIVDKAQSALQLLDSNATGDEAASVDAAHEALKIALENQVTIAETLDLIKIEFDKFEAGLSKIL